MTTKAILLGVVLAGSSLAQSQDHFYELYNDDSGLLAILSPPGAGYDSPAGNLYTASGGAVTVSAATPRQYCPHADGTLTVPAVNKPCVPSSTAIRIRSAISNAHGATYASFDNAAFTKVATTVSADVALAPDGTTTADKVIATNAVASREIYQPTSVTSGTTYTQTYYLKSAERRYVQVIGPAADFGNTWHVNFDATTCTVTANVGGLATAVATTAANGFCRVSVSKAAIGTSGTGRLSLWFIDTSDAGRVATSSGNGTDGIIVWGSQFVAGSVAGDLCPSASSCPGETATVPTPADLSRTEGCVCLNITPSWTGANPASTVSHFLAGDAAGTVRFGYVAGSAGNYQAGDGTNFPFVAAGFVSGTDKRYCTRWSAGQNLLKVENVSAGTSSTSAFTTFPAFDANLAIGGLAGGTLQSNVNLSRITFGRSFGACQ